MVFWQQPDNCLLWDSECILRPVHSVCVPYLCVCAYVWVCCSHQLHEALAALRGDDAEVRLTTAHHLRAGRRWGFGLDYFPHITVWDTGDREEAWGGPGTDVAISYKERGYKCVMGTYTNTMCLSQHTHTRIFFSSFILPGKTTVTEYLHSRKKVRLSLL